MFGYGAYALSYAQGEGLSGVGKAKVNPNRSQTGA